MGGLVAGVDEVGRGPLAGPVLAAACLFEGGLPDEVADLVDDSKKLSHAQRQRAYEAFRPYARIALGAASVAEIDRINILGATHLAMARAVARLGLGPCRLLIDGNSPTPACRLTKVLTLRDPPSTPRFAPGASDRTDARARRRGRTPA